MRIRIREISLAAAKKLLTDSHLVGSFLRKCESEGGQRKSRSVIASAHLIVRGMAIMHIRRKRAEQSRAKGPRAPNELQYIILARPIEPTSRIGRALIAFNSLSARDPTDAVCVYVYIYVYTLQHQGERQQQQQQQQHAPVFFRDLFLIAIARSCVHARACLMRYTAAVSG